jgi:ADP-heptose:LPS heptosyltransferase
MIINRVLIMRGGAVGDFIVTLPVMGALRQTFPQAWIEVLGHPSRALLAHHPRYADRVTDLESWDVYRLFQPAATVSSRLEAYLQSFDLIVAYLPTTDGVFNRQLRQYCHGNVITWSPHPPAGIHVTDYLLQALEPLALQGIEPYPRLELNAEAEAKAGSFWQASGYSPSVKGVVAFHPGSGSQQKLWPVEGWRQVIGWARQHGIEGVVIQGPAEQERGIEDTLRPVTGDWPWARGLSLQELAALTRRCQAVLSHDSGVAHLAAAAGSTTLALFGPTDPYVWGPRSPRACVLQPPVPQPLTLCNLPPETVIQTLAAVLDGTFAWQPTSVPCTIIRLGSD